MSEPFISILNGFAEATSRMARDLQTRKDTYRCPECDAITRRDRIGNPPRSVACWATDCGVFCTGRAALVQTYDCDACGKPTPRDQIRRGTAFGLETFACEDCWS